MNLNPLKIAMSAAILPLLATGCNTVPDNVPATPDVEITDGKMSPEVLEAFGRINDVQPSPDGKLLAFTIGHESIETNSSSSDIYIMNSDGTDIRQLTRTEASESNVRWTPDGKLAFISKDKGMDKRQIFVMNPDGSEMSRVSEVEGGVLCFEISPNGQKIVLGSEVDAVSKDSTLYAGLPKTTGRVINDLMYKHWDEWVTSIPHPFVADFAGNNVANPVDIMAGEPYECPMKPFGGADAFAWSADSKQLVYVSRKLTGKEYSLSTNSDLYLYDLASGNTKNLTEGDAYPGYDTDPAFSPDGTKLAWLSMPTPGFESDKKRLMIRDLKTGTVTDLTQNWDYWPEGIAWSPDSKAIFFNGYYQGTMPIFRIDMSAKIDTVATGIWDYVGVRPLSTDKVVALRHSMRRPNEICVAGKGNVQDITKVNEGLLNRLNLGEVKKVMVPTTDGKQMLTWVILPPNFDPNKKYPALLYCQGGPQQAVSQFWSYRWNFMIMSANDYVIIAPNRRGLPGFGTEWNEQISKDYGGQNMRDYFAAVDYMKANAPYIDGNRIGAIGASYGGFSVYWLAGHHEGRFAAFVAHAGIFNMEAQYLETEEMWFANYDMGGAPWETANAAAQATFATSPHKFVDKWTAPILVTVGELDYRILASQGMMAFNAAKLRGLEAEMLVFPDENHWIIKPQNAVLWQRTFFAFLDRYLKNGSPKQVSEPTTTPKDTVGTK